MADRNPESEHQVTYMSTYRPDLLPEDIAFVEGAMRMDVDIEPFRQAVAT